MTIIEAIQQAEWGKLMVHPISQDILRYMGQGKFWQYKMVNGVTQYKYEVHSFSMGEILANNWTVIENTYLYFPASKNQKQ